MTRKVHKSISDAGQIEGVNTIEKVVLPVEPKTNHNINPSAKRRHRIFGLLHEAPYWNTNSTLGGSVIINYDNTQVNSNGKIKQSYYSQTFKS